MTPTKAHACLEGKRVCAFDHWSWDWPKSLAQMLDQVSSESRVSVFASPYTFPTPFSLYEAASPNTDCEVNGVAEGNAPEF